MPPSDFDRTILILGASARAAAASASRGGLLPIAIDLFADADLQRLGPASRVASYPHGFVDAAQRAPMCPWMYTGGLENHPEIIDAIAAARPLFGNSGRVLRQVRNPFVVHEAMKESAHQAIYEPQHVSPTSILDDGETGQVVLCSPELCASADELPHDGSWLAKRSTSSGGRHVQPWHGPPPSTDSGAGDELRAGNVAAEEKPWHFQRRIEGLPVGAVFVASRGECKLLGVTRQLTGTQWLGARDYWYCGSIGPLSLSVAQQAAFVELGKFLSKRFSLVGLFGIDAIVTSDAIFLVEINPRFPASVEVLERTGGFSAVALHVTACRASGDVGALTHAAAPPHDVSACGTTLLEDSGSAPSFSHTAMAGKAILYATEAVHVDTATAEALLEAASRHPPPIADVPLGGTDIQPGHPIVTLLADGCDESAVVRELQSRTCWVQELLRLPRRDFG